MYRPFPEIMSQPYPPNTDTRPPAVAAAGAAGRTADDAADRAGVQVRVLHTGSQTTALVELFATIWGVDQDHPPVDPSIVAALSHGGGYVSGAYRGTAMVAASIGFVTGDTFDTLHSHITGVLDDHAGSGVGTAIKLHQRSWAVQHGLPWMTWTFDPLIARNARFNLHRLGARLEEYLIDFYGSMNDGRNRGQPSDRAFARWDLTAPPLPSTIGSVADDHSAAPMNAVLTISDDAPQIDQDGLAAALGGDGRPVELIIPSDIESIRSCDLERALDWRLALRATLKPLLGSGWQVAGFGDAGSRADKLGDNRRGRYRLVRSADIEQD